MTKDNATPRPWSINDTHPNQIECEGMEGFRGLFKIAKTDFSNTLARTANYEEAKANARLIVKACNNYDDLVDSLRGLINAIGGLREKEELNKAKKVLQKAEREE